MDPCACLSILLCRVHTDIDSDQHLSCNFNLVKQVDQTKKRDKFPLQPVYTEGVCTTLCQTNATFTSQKSKSVHMKKKEFSQKKKESNSNGKDIHLQSTIPLFVDMR
jgi:hypothetical protein